MYVLPYSGPKLTKFLYAPGEIPVKGRKEPPHTQYSQAHRENKLKN